VAASLVVDGADQGGAVHPPRQARQVLADAHAGHRRRHGPELAAHLRRGVGLEVEHVLGGGAAEQVEADDVLGLAGRAAGLCGGGLGPEQFGQGQPAQGGEGTGPEGLAAAPAVAEAPRAAEQREHDRLLARAGRGGRRRLNRLFWRA
jgi:hypothetical protein